MPNLKDLKNRIASVQSTRKITSAMKMVAASKLRRAQEQAEASGPYAERMGRMLSSLAANVQDSGNGPKLMTGTGADKVHLLVVISSDRGLCGAFNGSIVREAKRQITRLQGEGKTVKVLTVGRKGRDQLRREFASLIVESYEDVGRRRLGFSDADMVASKVLAMFDAGEFDVCSVVFNKFKSAISQIVTVQQLIPFAVPGEAVAATDEVKPLYEFEPDEEQILAELLPRNLSIQNLPRPPGERRVRAGRPDDRDGQRDAQRRRHDQQADDHLQPDAPGLHHQGADRDHLRCRGPVTAASDP